MGKISILLAEEERVAGCRSETPAGPTDTVMRVVHTTAEQLLMVLVLGVTSFLAACGPAQQPADPVESIRIGAFKGEEAALVWLAESEGFFSRYGLQARRLSRTVRPEERDDLSPLDGERNAGDGDVVSEGLSEVLEADHDGDSLMRPEAGVRRREAPCRGGT